MAGATSTAGMELTWFRSCVERMADFVFAIDADGVVVYANPATFTWIGLQPEEIVGRSCLDFLHPDDVERAIATIAYGQTSDRAEVPVTFRIHTRAGWETFEVRGHGLGTDPDGATMLVVARESNGSELLDELLDNLAAGDDFEHALELISMQMCRQLWQTAAGVVYRDENGRRRAATVGVPGPLIDALTSDADAPWVRAALRGEDVVVRDLDLLAPPLAAVMRGSGFGAVIAVPVVDPLFREPACLVVLGPDWLQPVLGLGVAITRVKRLLRVALRQRYQREMLERTARTDPLTGLANRRRFFHRLEEEVERLAGDARHQVAVVFLDLDGFKAVNDTHGHSDGDMVLREVATRVQNVVGDTALAARLGGDEFAVLVLHADPDEIETAVVLAIERPIQLPDGEVRVGASSGVSRALQGDAPESVVERADALAYEVKRLRR